MNSLENVRVSRTLETLHQAADATDRDLMADVMSELDASGETLHTMIAKLLADEKADYAKVYRDQAERFLAVSPDYGRFLYTIARARNARRIVEFGTSMGISTIYLAAALRDNGGGQLIGSELQPSKAGRARANIEVAGFSDLVDIREGDALETLADAGGAVDVLLIDGAFSLYLPVLKLLEPFLVPGSVVLGENAFDRDYLDYVRNPDNGYVSQPLAIDEGRGNELTVRVR